MLTLKEVLKQLTAATWPTDAARSAFVSEAGSLAVSDFAKVLSCVIDERARGEQGYHGARCAAFAGLVQASADPGLFVLLARALRDADGVLRDHLVALLPRVNSSAGHGVLCELLGDREAPVRLAAANVLRQVGGRSAFERVVELARDPSFSGRISALDVFASKAGSLAVPLFEAVIEVGTPAEIIHALSFIGDARLMSKNLAEAVTLATKVLARTVADESADAAVLALANLASEDDFFSLLADRLEDPPPHVARALVTGMQRFSSKRVVDYLLLRFRAGPNLVRYAVLEAARAIASEQSIPVIVEALQFGSVVIRARAAEIIAQLGREAKVEPARCVIWLLRSRDVNVRRLAIEIARQVGDRGGDLGPSLLKYLRDEDWWVRERTVDALIETMGTGLTRHLAEFLKDDSDVVRRWAVGSLRRVKDPKALGALVRVAADDSDWWVREQAIEAIGELGDLRAVPHLLGLLNRVPDARSACIAALTALHARGASAEVAALLQDADADVRLAALQFISVVDASSEKLAVKRVEADQDPRVQRLAAELLSSWKVAVVEQPTDDRIRSLLDRLLAALAKADADDLLIAVGQRPYVKRLGKMVALSESVFTEDQVKAILLPQLTRVQQAQLAELRDVDFSYEVRALGLRFRANVFQQMKGLSAVFRIVKNVIPELASLGLPDVVQTFADYKNGLVIVGGPTGSGKSTTLAALVDFINRNQSEHIITIEDPIEVIHRTKKCLINQREVGAHTASFEAALRRTLRQDPDVILIGEMRDLETISFAITAAETGHLVFGTLHTASADTSVDRLIDSFPPGQQPQIRAMLSESLRAVVCQHLLRRKNGNGRVLAAEVMLGNTAVSNLIRKGKCFQIPQVITTSREQGMQSMDMDLARLVRDEVVALDDAYSKAVDKKAFEAMVNDGVVKRAASSPRQP